MKQPIDSSLMHDQIWGARAIAYRNAGLKEIIVSCMFSPRSLLCISLIVAGYVFVVIAHRTLSHSDKLSSRSLPLPPGPRPWPIVGSLFQITKLLHLYFAEMAREYGPIVHVKLGFKHFVAVHTPELAMEVLRSRDVEFACRPASVFGEHFSFGYQDIAMRPDTDATWRHLRKVCSTSLFHSSRLMEFVPLRQEEIRVMVSKLRSAAAEGGSSFVAKARPLIYESNMNVISGMLFGKKYFGDAHDSCGPEAASFRTMLETMAQESGKFHLGDFFPPLRGFDLLGTERRIRDKARPAFEKFFAARLSEHKQELYSISTGNCIKDEKNLLDVLLSLKNEDSVSDNCIMGLLTDLMTGGSSTGTISVEWALSELIAHPPVLLKAQMEIDNVVGLDRLVQESDLPNLPYLDAIIKETLRLHPSFPMLLPHYNPVASQLGRYRIPAGSTVLVNIWAMGRDPAIWSNPREFDPSRFLGLDIDMQLVGGKQCRLIPFSTGRRQCPGYPLASLQVPHRLAALIQAFNWSPPAGQKPEDISMEEATGVASYRAVPLEAAVSYRLKLDL